MPQVGVDYPGTWQSLEAWFPDDEACREFLARLRWGDGFCCPVCDGSDASGSWTPTPHPYAELVHKIQWPAAFERSG